MSEKAKVGEFEKTIRALLDMCADGDWERAAGLCDALTKLVRRKRLEAEANVRALELSLARKNNYVC